jgi:hypothetical protein
MDPSAASLTTKVIPAQLSFLAIYNPALGATEETFQDQILFYYSREAYEKRRQQNEDLENLQDEKYERERQIGLAQGMVNFAK